MNWTLLQHSLLVSGLAVAGSVAVGFAGALWLAGVNAVWRRRLLLLAVLALVLPPFLVTNCWLDLLGLNGLWRGWWPFNIYSLWGAAWVLTLLTWPIPLLATLGAWRRLQASQLESDPALCGWPLIRWLLWPMARVAVGQAAVLAFVLALNNFTVPAILQVKVFPAEVWLRFSTNFDSAGALALSWPLIAAPACLLLVFRRAEIDWPRAEGEPTARALRRQLGAGWQACCGAVTVLAILFSVALPLAELVCALRTWIELPQVLRATSGVVWNSFGFAAVTATFCVALGLVTWRLRIGLILWLPFLVPGVLLGVAMIFVLNRPVLDAVYRSVMVVVVGFSVRYLGFAWNGVAHAMRSVDRDLIDAARVEGASAWQLLRCVRWPLAAPQVAAAWYVTYLLCLWDVETLVLIVPPGGETLALRVFNLLHYGHNAQVNALCVVLLGLAMAPLGVAGVARRVARWNDR
jgi:iron(III) transport system permease protein